MKVEVLKNVTAEEILHHPRTGPEVIIPSCSITRRDLRKVYINGLKGFLRYAKERIIKFHGISKKKFPFLGFRYNNRSRSLFEMIVQYCNMVAKTYIITKF